MINIDFNKIGTFLITLRKNSMITQTQLANQLNVTKSAISQWEKGFGINIENLYNLSKFYNISIDDILSCKIKRSNLHYWFNYFKISNEDLKRSIFEKQYDVLEFYCNKIIHIKDEFCRLFKLWVFDKLTDFEEQLFVYLKKYFNEDMLLLDFGAIEMKPKLQEQFLKMNNNKDFDRYLMLSHYSFNMNLYLDYIINKKDYRALELVVSTLYQQEKNWLLNGLFYKNRHLSFNNDIENDEPIYYYNLNNIEEDPVAKVLLNSGCCIIGHFPIGPDYYISHPKSLNFKGKVKKDVFIGKKPFYLSLPDDYSTYQDTVNNLLTSYFKALVNYKDNEPVKYYNELINLYSIE